MVVFEGRVKMIEEIKRPGTKKEGILNKVLIPMVTSPTLGLVGGFLMMSLLYILLRPVRPVWVNRVFGKLQLVSSGYMGWSHGMNDATKTMGLITLALVTATSAGFMKDMPGWLQVDKSADPLHLTPVDHFIALLPSWLQFGYMPEPADLQEPRHSGVGYRYLCADDGCRHRGRWMENHQNHGPQSGQASAGAWIRRRNDGRHEYFMRRPRSACRFPPPTRLPLPSWASVARNDSAPSNCESSNESSGPGFSPSRSPPDLPSAWCGSFRKPE